MNLLEQLAQETGCLYLSDLHRKDVQSKLLAILPTLQPEAYSLREWNEVLNYVTGLTERYMSPEAAYQALKIYASVLSKEE